MKGESTKIDKKYIAIIGLGYVGLPLALLANRKGYEVVGIVRTKKKVEIINKKISPFADEVVKKYLPQSTIFATNDYSAVRNVSTIIICVPTPVRKNHTPNLDPVISAATGIAENLQKGQLIILESTVNPGVCEEVIIPILEKKSGFTAGKDFFLVHCPERINPGDKEWTIENIPRVIGGNEEEGLRKAIKFYESILQVRVHKMSSLKEAEACKIVENAFRDINIAFVNELALSFSKLDIDVVSVINGAATKPFGFMPHYPGCGVGGHCIPVDPYYLIEYAQQKGFHHDFLSLARNINNRMPLATVDLLVDVFKQKKISIRGARIAVLGLSYKANIDDDRESPAYRIIKRLEEIEADVVVFDPYLQKKSTAPSLQKALDKAVAVIIVTAHTVFTELTPSQFASFGIQVVIDGRNCLSKESFMGTGVQYKGIGR